MRCPEAARLSVVAERSPPDLTVPRCRLAGACCLLTGLKFRPIVNNQGGDGSGGRIFGGPRSPWRASGVNTGGCFCSQSTHNIGRSSRELFFMGQSWDLRPAGTVGGARLLFMVSTGFLLWLDRFDPVLPFGLFHGRGDSPVHGVPGQRGRPRPAGGEARSRNPRQEVSGSVRRLQG